MTMTSSAPGGTDARTPRSNTRPTIIISLPPLLHPCAATGAARCLLSSQLQLAKNAMALKSDTRVQSAGRSAERQRVAYKCSLRSCSSAIGSRRSRCCQPGHHRCRIGDSSAGARSAAAAAVVAAAVAVVAVVAAGVMATAGSPAASCGPTRLQVAHRSCLPSRNAGRTNQS